jgi:hypothetical protein
MDGSEHIRAEIPASPDTPIRLGEIPRGLCDDRRETPESVATRFAGGLIEKRAPGSALDLRVASRLLVR